MTTKPSTNMIAGLATLLSSTITLKGASPANLNDALESGIYTLDGTAYTNLPTNTVTANTRSALVVYDLGNGYKIQLVFPYGSTSVMASRTGVTNSSTGATAFTPWIKPATSGHSHTAVSTTVNGFMSAADKTKLDALPTNTDLQTTLDSKVNNSRITISTSDPVDGADGDLWIKI